MQPVQISKKQIKSTYQQNSILDNVSSFSKKGPTLPSEPSSLTLSKNPQNSITSSKNLYTKKKQLSIETKTNEEINCQLKPNAHEKKQSSPKKQTFPQKITPKFKSPPPKQSPVSLFYK